MPPWRRVCLDDYRAFRHVVRNVYSFNLRPARLADLVEGLSACHGAVSRDLLAFAAWLERMARSDDHSPDC